MTSIQALLADCRRAIGEVRFGFGSKRQVWAFEERHQLDAAALVGELPPGQVLDFALAFYAEFGKISNPWRVRDRTQALLSDLCRGDNPEFVARVVSELVDGNLVVRHWLVSAFLSAPPQGVFDGLEAALGRAYQPADQWALLSRLKPLAEAHRWTFSTTTVARLAALAQHAFRAEDRLAAVELLANHGGEAAVPVLARAAKGEADLTVRKAASSAPVRS